MTDIFLDFESPKSGTGPAACKTFALVAVSRDSNSNWLRNFGVFKIFFDHFAKLHLVTLTIKVVPVRRRHSGDYEISISPKSFKIKAILGFGQCYLLPTISRQNSE